MRPKIQYPLAFRTEGRGETLDADHEGTESPLAKRDTQSPATGESHCRTLNSIEPPWYGPVCPVVWEGRSREAPPYPDQAQLCGVRGYAECAAAPFETCLVINSLVF